MDVLVRAILPYDTGLPRDVVVNDFAIIANGGTAPQIGPLQYFYNDSPAGPGTGLAQLLHERLSREEDACTFQIYLPNVATGAIGQPVAEFPWTLQSASQTGESMPPEVALCTSFHSTYGTGVPKARCRGRLFLGPFNTSAMGDSVPNASTVNFIAAATQRLVEQLAENNAALAVWSRSDAQFKEVVGGWVDNAWDTQRRRGLDATNRVTWAV